MAMRIALFSGNYNYLREGANMSLNRLVHYLESTCGHEVRAYSPVTDTPAFAPAGTLVPVPSIALPVRNEFRLALGLPKAIRDDIKRFGPDLIHVSTPDILNTRAQTFAKRRGIPVVASLHTLFETYLDYYRIGWLRGPLEAHLGRFYRRCDHVVVPTPAIADDIAALRGDSSVTVWSRGVDRAHYDPARRSEAWRKANGFAPHDVVVLFFGRLVLEKGIDSFVAAIEAARALDPHVRALVIGEGPARALFDGLPDAVLTGHIEGDELAAAVASADIMLHPSVTETFGNVVLEAMASGLAVVAADAPSSRHLLDDGDNGILYPSGDIAAAAEAVLSLAEDPARRAALGAIARERSAAYTWDGASARVEAAYRRVLDERATAATRLAASTARG